MAKKRKKPKQEKENKEVLELEKELSELEPDSTEQFAKEEKEAINRYIG